MHSTCTAHQGCGDVDGSPPRRVCMPPLTTTGSVSDEAAENASTAANERDAYSRAGHGCLLRALLRRVGGVSGLIYSTALISVVTAT